MKVLLPTACVETYFKTNPNASQNYLKFSNAVDVAWKLFPRSHNLDQFFYLSKVSLTRARLPLARTYTVE
jgi:hypothetical protein